MASITFVPRPTPIKIDAQDAESKTFQGFEQDNKDIIEWLNTSMKKLNADEGIAKKTIVKIKSKVLPGGGGLSLEAQDGAMFLLDVIFDDNETICMFIKGVVKSKDIMAKPFRGLFDVEPHLPRPYLDHLPKLPANCTNLTEAMSYESKTLGVGNFLPTPTCYFVEYGTLPDGSTFYWIGLEYLKEGYSKSLGSMESIEEGADRSSEGFNIKFFGAAKCLAKLHKEFIGKVQLASKTPRGDSDKFEALKHMIHYPARSLQGMLYDTVDSNQMIKELFENFGKGGTLDKLIKRKEEENDGVCWERIIVAPSLYFWPEEVRGNVELEAKEKEKQISLFKDTYGKFKFQDDPNVISFLKLMEKKFYSWTQTTEGVEQQKRMFDTHVTRCHGDCHFGNMMYNLSTKEVKFYDFEFSSSEPVVVELYYLFSLTGLSSKMDQSKRDLPTFAKFLKEYHNVLGNDKYDYNHLIQDLIYIVMTGIVGYLMDFKYMLRLDWNDMSKCDGMCEHQVTLGAFSDEWYKIVGPMLSKDDKDGELIKKGLLRTSHPFGMRIYFAMDLLQSDYFGAKETDMYKHFFDL